MRQVAWGGDISSFPKMHLPISASWEMASKKFLSRQCLIFGAFHRNESMLVFHLGDDDIHLCHLLLSEDNGLGYLLDENTGEGFNNFGGCGEEWIMGYTNPGVSPWIIAWFEGMTAFKPMDHCSKVQPEDPVSLLLTRANPWTSALRIAWLRLLTMNLKGRNAFYEVVPSWHPCHHPTVHLSHAHRYKSFKERSEKDVDVQIGV